jgi:hypothetical protein
MYPPGPASPQLGRDSSPATLPPSNRDAHGAVSGNPAERSDAARRGTVRSQPWQRKALDRPVASRARGRLRAGSGVSGWLDRHEVPLVARCQGTTAYRRPPPRRDRSAAPHGHVGLRPDRLPGVRPHLPHAGMLGGHRPGWSSEPDLRNARGSSVAATEWSNHVTKAADSRVLAASVAVAIPIRPGPPPVERPLREWRGSPCG